MPNTYVLIPGAGGSAWYWHLLVDELRRRGAGAVAVELPAADDTAGLAEYADATVEAVVEAVGDRAGLVVVAQSLGGFTGPLVCERLPVDLLVLLNAMVPTPGESAGDWWAATGHVFEGDPLEEFFHDVPAEVRAEAMAMGAPAQSARPFQDPWPLARWPDVPTRFLQGRDDHFFPPEFQRRVVGARLGVPVDEMPGGHLVALSRPAELADRLEAYARERNAVRARSRPDPARTGRAGSGGHGAW